MKAGLYVCITKPIKTTMRTIILTLATIVLLPHAQLLAQCNFTSNPGASVPINISNSFTNGEEGFTGDFSWNNNESNLIASDVQAGSKTIITPLLYKLDEASIFLQFDLGAISDATITGYSISAQTAGNSGIQLCSEMFSAGSELAPAVPTAYYVKVPAASIPEKTYFKFVITFFYTGLDRPGLVFDNFGSNIPMSLGTLPVRFGNFTARKSGSEVKLQWEAFAEENVKEYVVEKSLDGKLFTTAGVVKATGRHIYNYSDKSPEVSGFYRIKAADHDGKFSFSTVKRTRSSEKGSMLKAFMKQEGLLEVQHDAAVEGTYLEVFTAEGLTLINQPVRKGETQTLTRINSGYSGVLVIRFRSGGETESLKIHKW